MPRLIKPGQCQYPGCNLDLSFVHIARKYCQVHRIIKIKQNGQEAHRRNYKSKFHREHVVRGDFLRSPKRLPPGLKESMPCPGNGNGFCGAILRRERAMDDEQCTTNYYDYFCGTHRFPDPREEK